MVTKHVTDAVAALEAGKVPEWISDHLRAYRDSGGTVGHYWDSTDFGGDGLKTCLLLKTVGRRTGKTYVHPLLYGKDGDNYLLVASQGGAPDHPQWYKNLVAQPEVQVQVLADRFTARARTATPEEKARLWPAMTAHWPAFDEYQAKTSRDIPLVILERV